MESSDIIVRLVKLFCEDFRIALVYKEEVSQWFDIKTIVKQGCKEFCYWLIKSTVGQGDDGLNWNSL